QRERPCHGRGAPATHTGTPGAAALGGAATRPPEYWGGAGGRLVSKDGSIGILAYEFGLHPKIVPLNPALRPDATTLKLKLRIVWEPEDPTASLSALEGALLDVCPSIARHECRGPREYHVHRFAREGM